MRSNSGFAALDLPAAEDRATAYESAAKMPLMIHPARSLASIAIFGPILTLSVLGSIACSALGQEAEADAGTPHLRRHGSATQLIVDGKPMLLLAGELHNSSASSLAYMEPIWPRLKALRLNTVLATATWEQIEPHEGTFDFSLIDGLIDAARANDLRLVLLWFGTWKNARSTYVPEWVKTDLDRFVHAQRPTSQHSDKAEPISAWSDNACRADAAAFAALMHHLKQVDSRRRTVVMIQVENETGLLGFSRDHRPEAERDFAGPVPHELMEYLTSHRGHLIPELENMWKSAGQRESGTWQEVFGKGTSPAEIYSAPDASDEPFMAWHVARFVNAVAEAGKKEYPLPMYANAWLKGSAAEPPGRYPSGGPVPRMMDVWHAAAPSIDVLAPDIYLPDFRGICASFAQNGNPLLIPEAAPGDDAPANAFTAFAGFDAICYSPFGIDSLPPTHPLEKAYDLLGQLMPVLAEHQGKGEIALIRQWGNEPNQEIDLGGYHLHVRFTGKGGRPVGVAIATGPDEYILAGWGFDLEFQAHSGKPPHVELLLHEEGRFDGGKWIPGRRMNGDEYLPKLDEPSIRKIKLFAYR